jgi:hypothetical protein
MARITLKIPSAYRYFFYASLGLCWSSGLGFWFVRRFAMVEGDFGPEPNMFQYPLLQAHGLAAFIMLLCLGAIFSAHVPTAWASRRERLWGMGLLVQVLVSVLSAYTLYYLVTEDWHEWLGNGHAFVGLLLPAMLWLHIYTGRRKRKLASINYS